MASRLYLHIPLDFHQMINFPSIASQQREGLDCSQRSSLEKACNSKEKVQYINKGNNLSCSIIILCFFSSMKSVSCVSGPSVRVETGKYYSAAVIACWINGKHSACLADGGMCDAGEDTTAAFS